MKKMVLIGLATVSSMFLAGCGSGTATDSGGEVGVTDTEIHLGTTAPLSGPAASYADDPAAMKAYFDYINDQGGVNGRKISLTVYDDAFDPSKTVPLTQKLIDQDKVFAIVGGVGTAPQSAVYQRLNAQKVPDVLIGSGASIFANPPLPYVTALLPSYRAEDKLLAEHIKKSYPGKKVGIIYQNDDTGQEYLKVVAPTLGSSVVAKASFEITDSSVSAQVNNLKNSGAEVVAYSGTPKFLALALLAARGQAWDAPFVTNGSAVDASLFKLAGPAAEGVVTATGFKLATDTSDPEIKKATDILSKYAPNVKPGASAIYGIANGEIFVEALKAAGKNLTRDSLVKALNNLTVPSGVWYGPVKITPTQRNAVQCEQFLRVTGGTTVPFGGVECPS